MDIHQGLISKILPVSPFDTIYGMTKSISLSLVLRAACLRSPADMHIRRPLAPNDLSITLQTSVCVVAAGRGLQAMSPSALTLKNIASSSPIVLVTDANRDTSLILAETYLLRRNHTIIAFAGDTTSETRQSLILLSPPGPNFLHNARTT